MAQTWTALRDAIAKRQVLGTFVKLPAPETIEIAAALLDFVVVDLEHSQLDDMEARRLVRHAAALGFPAVVRIASVDRERVNRLLEAGAAGIQLSTVRSAAQVRELRALMRYAPEGERSISLGHAGAGYGASALADYLDEQDGGPLLVAQIETASTDDPLAAIVAERPDVVFVGPMDLTVALGRDRARVARRIAEIADAASEGAVALGGATIEAPHVRYEVTGSDVGLLRSAMAHIAEKRNPT